MTNPFTGNGFDMIAMTAAVNKLPNLYGRLAELNLFPFEGISTTSVAVEQLNGTLNIVRSRPRGAPADINQKDKRTMKSFGIPYFPLDDVLLPEDYQNVRAFGSETAMETQASIMARKLQRMRNALDQTLEYVRMGALKGIVYDADAAVIYNFYDEFGITAKSIDFVLDDEDTEVMDKCLETKRWIEMHLYGERMSGVRCLCDGTFYDALTKHPKVEKAFAAYQALNQNLAEDYRRGFRFGGIVFEEYPATWTDKDGNTRLAIASGTGHCFPEGTGETFKTVVAPGNFLETANTVGIPYYAKQEPRKFNQGLDIHTEMNVLPICLRPEVLVTITA